MATIKQLFKEILNYTDSESIKSLFYKTNEIIDNINNNSYTPPYKVYSAQLSQVGIADPEPVELENTLGTIEFSRISQGYYKAISSGLFVAGKTFATITNTRGAFIDCYIIDVNEISISTKDVTSDSPFIPSVDDALDNTSFEIRVYN